MNMAESKLKSLPKSPGVYLFKNAKEEILYVGKAKNLRNRVRSYFSQSHDLAPRTKTLISKISDFEYILTDTETESLMLENNLIKKYKPRYNILLRDDKNYQFIKIDYAPEIPQIYTTRKLDQLRRHSERSEESPSTKGYKDPSLVRLGGRIRMTKKRIKKPTTYPPTGDHPKGDNLQPNRYFGPYTSGKSVRETLRLLRYILPYCSNKKIGTRPCFYYHLGRCPGVCAGKISQTEYRVHLKKIERFLAGEMQKTQKSLKREMQLASAKKLFEKAARLRDQTHALATMLEKQKIVSPTRESYDTVSLFQAGTLATITLFQIRDGKLIGRENFILDNTKEKPEAAIIEAFLKRYYLEASDVPGEINIPVISTHNLISNSSPKSERRTKRSLSHLGEGRGGVTDKSKNRTKPNYFEQLEKALFKKIGNKIIITSPSRGRKARLIKLGRTNAQDYLQTTSENLGKEQAIITRALFELKDRLQLPDVPLRIEAFDISNIQGTNPTGSMVVFENGKAKKSDYKRFAVRGLSTPNDVEMMREVLSRRFSHAPAKRLPPPSPRFAARRAEGEDRTWRLPDLIVVDGGRAQLNTALSVLKIKKLKVPVIGLAKKLEKIYRAKIKSPMRLPDNSQALHLLQRLRDEAHRFAVTYHRKRRSKGMIGK